MEDQTNREGSENDFTIPVLNDVILQVIDNVEFFPRELGYRFTPLEREEQAMHINPRDPYYDGVCYDIYYPNIPTADGGSNNHSAGDSTESRIVIARKTPESSENVSYCCGVTFAAWFYAMKMYHSNTNANTIEDMVNPFSTLSAADFHNLVHLWFCPVMGHDGVVTALESKNLGRRIRGGLKNARKGDLVQYWRNIDLLKPSGHSVVFIKYEIETITNDINSSSKSSNNEGSGIVQPSSSSSVCTSFVRHRLYYWSSQRSTNGVGYHVEEVICSDSDPLLLAEKPIWQVDIVRPFVTFFPNSDA